MVIRTETVLGNPDIAITYPPPKQLVTCALTRHGVGEHHLQVNQKLENTIFILKHVGKRRVHSELHGNTAGVGIQRLPTGRVSTTPAVDLMEDERLIKMNSRKRYT